MPALRHPVRLPAGGMQTSRAPPSRRASAWLASLSLGRHAARPDNDGTLAACQWPYGALAGRWCARARPSACGSGRTGPRPRCVRWHARRLVVHGRGGWADRLWMPPTRRSGPPSAC